MDKKVVATLVIIAIILATVIIWFLTTSSGLFEDDLNIDPDNGLVLSKIEESVEVRGVQITAIDVVEDSRCPVDAVCFQSGTVRVRANIVSSDGEILEVFTINKPMAINSETIELVQVKPEASTRNPSLAVSDYEFVWQVEPIE